ncbi:MAG: ATP-binding cassette domain-containing protein [Candidatus Kryptoniota bacterium]
MRLKVNQLSRFFGDTAAVSDVSFEIDKPSVVGFLGPNGAGKTTTMRIITGFLAPSKGTVTIDDVTSDNVALRSRIGYLPESNPLYTELEVHEYLRFAGELSGLSPEKTEERLRYVVDRCGIKEVLYDLIHQLSKGYKQRVGLAQAIIHDPEILILDEPTSGLDPNQVVGIRELISELAERKFVILSTHILSEVQALCDRVLIINKGKLVLDATSEELESAGASNISVIVKASSSIDVVKNIFETALQLRQTRYSTSKLSIQENSGNLSLQLGIADSFEIREKIFDLCTANRFKILELSKSGSDLEKIFRQLTTGNDETEQTEQQ